MRSSSIGRGPWAIRIVLVLLTTLGLARPVLADEELPSPENPEAKQQIDAGNKAFLRAQSRTDPEAQQRDFEEAILHYKAGARLETKHIITFYWNLGHAYRQMGSYTQADWFYRAFLDAAPAALVLHRGAAENFIAQMNDERNRKATLMGPTDPSPSPLKAPPSAPQVTEATPPGPPSAAESVAPWHGDRLGWGLLAAGTVGAVVGGGLLWSGSGLFHDASQQERQSVARDLEDRGRGRVTIGAVAGGVGVAVLVAGVVKLATTGGRAANRPVQVSLGPTSFSFVGRF